MTPHTQRLERWLGAELVAHLSETMRGFHGGPIVLGNLPGQVFVHNDGGFSGQIDGGRFASLADVYETIARRTKRAIRRAARANTLHMGFSSLSDLISEATTGGKRQDFIIGKTGATGVSNIANSLWDVGSYPPAGSAATGAAAGHSPDNTTAGGFLQSNPSGNDTLHLVTITCQSTISQVCLLLYDRFFAANHTMTVDPQSVTGVPTRYQDTTSKNTFITVFVTTQLAASTPTYTITYMDQDGNTAEAAAAQTIVSGAVVRRFPFAATVGNGWFIPLNAGDTGVRKITNLDLSAAMASGAVDVVLAKPYAWIPQPLASAGVIIDGINSGFNLVQITNSSCLALMEVTRNQTSATSYSGQLVLVSG